MSITATEDIFITKNDKTIAKLVSPYQDKIALVDQLYGSVPDTLTMEEAKEERLNQI